ncbi:MAG: ribosomal protein S18 acetylase RimI-like enzyme [Akkermansiaceae bacterium]|jgi:ribosomal protein S18 acetylase RimI-like enzyme
MKNNMKNQMTVRESEFGDVGILVRFNLEMARETEGKELDGETLKRGVEGIFAKPERGFYFVAELEGELVGSLMVTKEWSDWRNGDFWWIQSVYVEPEFRRQGIFRALYEEARKRAMEVEGVCGCRLYVEKDNEAARAVYLKRGFEETPYRLFEDGF